jgi:tetraacyldisaccharide 4'-kinase
MSGSWVRRAWERTDVAGFLLWISMLPLSCCYFLAVQVRNLLYALDWLPVSSLPCPVVSVGNLTVGGTGKTPTTLWLSQELQRKGYRVAILSRGYKRDQQQPMLLEPGHEGKIASGAIADISAAGDEPVMMAKIFGQRVGVGKYRYEVGIQLWRQGRVDVFLLDDGFQHRGLRRDLDLLLLGQNARSWLLPGGPLREPKRAIGRADLCLITGSREDWEPLLAGRPGDSVFQGALKPKALLALERSQWKEYPLTFLGRSKILALSGIADPRLFYRMIHEWDGDIVDTMEFPDHHRYSPRDWQRISRAARDIDLIVTTEKDILKLVRFPFAKAKLFALRVEMVVENGAALIGAVEAIIRSKRAEA